MKKLLTFLLLCTLGLNISAQNIINVSNTAGTVADYATLQEAVTNATAGDIIYLAPSSTSYGNVNIDKQITIVGPGYWVLNNPSLGILTYAGNGTIGDATIGQGGSGTLITGCDFNYLAADGVTNMVIARCRIKNRVYLKNTNNVLIESNYFDSSAGNGSTTDENHFHLSANSNNNSLIVRGNIFNAYYGWTALGGQSSRTYFDNIFVGATSNAIVENNIFRDFCSFYNSVIRNNVFVATTNSIRYNNYATGSVNTPIKLPGTANNFSNNVVVQNQAGLPPSNLVGVDVNSLFEGYPSQGSRSFDDRFMLKAGSPAIGAGAGGIDCGAFDGVSPYQLSGLPFIPVVYELTGPSQGTSADGIDINVKVRSNN